MNKFLTYYSFIVVSLMVVSGFMGASSTPQLVSAILFYPMLIYFLSLVFPKKQKSIPPPQILKQANVGKPAIEEAKVHLEKPKSYDLNRRAFLKLIGTAGTSLFLFSIFTNKAKAAFFGSVPGPGTVAIKDTSGTPIDPAEKGPTDGYGISQLDADSTPSYYGYVNKIGAWYIMKEVGDGSYVYVRGATGFAGEWATRVLRDDYDTFDEIF